MLNSFYPLKVDYQSIPSRVSRLKACCHSSKNLASNSAHSSQPMHYNCFSSPKNHYFGNTYTANNFVGKIASRKHQLVSRRAQHRDIPKGIGIHRGKNFSGEMERQMDRLQMENQKKKQVEKLNGLQTQETNQRYSFRPKLMLTVGRIYTSVQIKQALQLAN